MNHVDQRLWALKHEPEGPLVPYLHAFASALDEQGFKRRVINPQIRLSAYFSQWLHARKIDVEDVTNEHARRFLATRENQASRRRGESATLKRLLCLLEQLGAIHPVPEHNDTTPIQNIVTRKVKIHISLAALIQVSSSVLGFQCTTNPHPIEEQREYAKRSKHSKCFNLA